MKICDCMSDMVICSLGPLQEAVLAPVLFALCTADATHHSPDCLLQKVADHSAVVWDGDSRAYREVVHDLAVEPPPDQQGGDQRAVDGHSYTQMNIQGTDRILQVSGSPPVSTG